MSPERQLKALDEAVMACVTLDADRRKPGALIARLPERIREGLRELKADVAANQRPEEWLRADKR